MVVDCAHLPRGDPPAAAAFLHSYLRGVLPSSSSSSSQEHTGTTPRLLHMHADGASVSVFEPVNG